MKAEGIDRKAASQPVTENRRLSDKWREIPASSARITPPPTGSVMPRPRLFELLDDFAGLPVTWLGAPAGSGKSTLVASYLEARNLPFLWYRCDADDDDPQAFFMSLGQSLEQLRPGSRERLPDYNPLGSSSLKAFSSRFFELLFDSLLGGEKQPQATNKVLAAVVIDGFESLREDSPFHVALTAGLASLPQGIRAFVISRSGPAPALTKLQASGSVAILPPKELLFHPEETAALIRRHLPQVSAALLDEVQQMTHGWAAGIVLTLDNGIDRNPEALRHVLKRLFDYLSIEVFQSFSPALSSFALQCAFLPILTAETTQRLTGNAHSARALEDLLHYFHFVELHSGRAGHYRFYPLCREFLQARAHHELGDQQVALLRLRSVAILEDLGYIAEAAQSCAELGDRKNFARILSSHARRFYAEGRVGLIADLLSQMPATSSEDPWLIYWRGVTHLPKDVHKARQLMEVALAGFEAEGSSSGAYASWAGLVDSYTYSLEEWEPLDDCLEIFESLHARWPEFEDHDVATMVASRMVMALMLRCSDDPRRIQGWLDRLDELQAERADLDVRMDTLFGCCIYRLWKGEFERNAVELQRAQAAMAQHTTSPFAAIRIHMMLGIHHWITANYQLAEEHLRISREFSQSSGINIFNSLLWSFEVASKLARGEMNEAEKLLAEQMRALAGRELSLDAFFYHMDAAWQQLLLDRPEQAAEHLRMVAPSARRMGNPYFRAIWRIGMAQCQQLMGNFDEAMQLIREAKELAYAMKSTVIEWYALLVEAWLELEYGNEANGLLALHRSLTLARRYGYVHLEFYCPEMMRTLMARALDEEIETAYVYTLIEKLALTPPRRKAHGTGSLILSENWPFPLKIYTMGSFGVVRNGRSINFSGKEPKKPLELLKTLIALGCYDVPAEALIDQLWPDTEGDLGYKSLEMTLSRLRKWLGYEDALLYRSRRLSINVNICWVDGMALYKLLDCLHKSGARAKRQRDSALKLYRGAFLADENTIPAAIPTREVLKSRMLHLLLAAGAAYCAEQQWELAADSYRQGINIDPLAEEFHRHLMQVQKQLGNYAEVVRGYHRCEALLTNELGTAPSPETTAVFRSVCNRPDPAHGNDRA